MGKLALVLSGGGARGAFQAGALIELLKYFEETGRRIDVLSGTSVGALNGMAIAQAATLAEARQALIENWITVTNPDIYKIRGWGLVGLMLKFALTPMDRWNTVPGVNSIFDNTPLYRKYVEGFLRIDLIHQRRTVQEFYVSLSSLNTGEAYLKSLTAEQNESKARDYLMASTITTVAYPPVVMTVEDPEIPPPLDAIPQMYADGGISNKTPLKTILKNGGISELFVVNTYPSYPNKTSHSIRATFPNAFSMLLRTALELLPNLYFLRDMQVVQDVNNDLQAWDRLKKELLGAAPDEQTRVALKAILDSEERTFSFKEGGKYIIHPVIIAPDEELPVQDTEFVQPKLGETFEMGRKKARETLTLLDHSGDKVSGIDTRKA